MNQRSTLQGGTSEQRDQAAAGLKSTVVEGAREVGGEVKERAGDVAQEARKTAESGLASGKERAAKELDHVAQAIRKTGQELRVQDGATLTPYLDRAARGVDSMAEYLHTHKLQQVLGDVEQFARREPALFLGGAFVAGLIGGRFLKSSRQAGVAASRDREAGREGASRTEESQTTTANGAF